LNIDELIRERTAQLHEKTQQLQDLQHAIIFSFADIVEARDEGTGGHIERTSTYIKIMIDSMTERGVYLEEIGKLDMESFVSSARLHDVGKVAISDTILNKPGKLSDDEFSVMKTHTSAGEHIMEQIAERTGNVEFVKNAKLFAGSHHERWDGRGYPRGLSGTDVPFQGRVMAFADVYDALVTERPYKKAFTPDKAVEIIMEGAGTQFDPLMAAVFFEVKDKFEEVSKSIGGAENNGTDQNQS
jgi:putative two-component system response regulator